MMYHNNAAVISTALVFLLQLIIDIGVVNGQGAVFSGANTTNNGLQTVVIGNGASNKATGINSIAMGQNTEAKHDASFVINLLDNKEAVSKNDHEFRVQAKVFAIRINDIDVKITKRNIMNFKNLLKTNPGSPPPPDQRKLSDIDNDLEEVKEMVENHNEEIKEQRELNKQQSDEIEQLHKSMEELYKQNEELRHMMIDVIALRQPKDKA